MSGISIVTLLFKLKKIRSLFTKIHQLIQHSLTIAQDPMLKSKASEILDLLEEITGKDLR